MKTLNSTIMMIFTIISVFVFLIMLNGNQKYDSSGFINLEVHQVHMKASDVILTPDEQYPEYGEQDSGKPSGVNDNRNIRTENWGSMGLWMSPSATNADLQKRLLAEM